MTVMPDRLTLLDGLTLQTGSHSSLEDGACVMEDQAALAQRLAGFLRPEGTCLVFTGTRTEDGYGNISVSGKTLKAHRVAYTLVHGPIADGVKILHRCDNPPCCYVDHLFPGTVAMNNADRHAKGRSRGLFESGAEHPATQRRGEHHWQAKLTASDVAQIRRRRAAGESVKALGIKFGVHHATISRVARGVWRQEVGQ